MAHINPIHKLFEYSYTEITIFFNKNTRVTIIFLVSYTVFNFIFLIKNTLDKRVFLPTKFTNKPIFNGLICCYSRAIVQIYPLLCAHYDLSLSLSLLRDHHHSPSVYILHLVTYGAGTISSWVRIKYSSSTGLSTSGASAHGWR